jgi:hypothetical protein
MTLPALATLDDVAAIIGRPLSTVETTNGTRLLGMASGMVRRYTRQQITQTVDDVIVLPGTWGHVLPLPQRPVQSVKSVLFGNSTAPATAWKLVGDDLFIGSGSYQPDYGYLNNSQTALWGPAGSVMGPSATGANWQGPQTDVTVTYTHGYAEVPYDIVNEVAGMVALQLSTSVGVQKERIGGYQVDYIRGEGGGMALTDETKKVLNFYRKRSASTSTAALR